MKVKIVGLLCVMALALLAIPANAQIFSLAFDEDGNGVLNGVTPDQGVLMIDPMSGLNALAYALPSNVGNGDVGVTDPNGSLSDGLRFEDIGATSFMFFFSADIGGGHLADTGIPDGGFADFTVAENQDGSFAFLAGGGGNNSYFGQSEGQTGTPEPASLLLLGSGLLGAIGVARRRFLS